MKPISIRLSVGIFLVALLALAGCRSVNEGPVIPPDPDQRPVITGKEPEHAPIPQKDVPPGESSLSHKKPDERIDQPKG